MANYTSTHTGAEIDAAVTARSLIIRRYTAVISQSTTGDPTVDNVLENTLGGTLVWTRNSAGSYAGTLTGAFTSASNKTICTADQDFYATGNIANGFRQGISRSSDNAVILVQYNNTLTPTDGFTMYIDIKVYS